MNWLIEILINRGNDLSTFFLPNAYFFKRSILGHNQIPLWNPTQFAGAPYVSDPQNYIFYLPNYLFLAFPVEVTFLLLIFTHLLLAGWGTYLLTKTIFNLKKLPALFCATLFPLSPMIMSHIEAGHYTMIVAFSWLPWFTLLAFKFFQKPTIKTIIYLSLVSWAIYINYINIIYFAILFFLSTATFYLITHLKKLNLKHYFLLLASYFLLLFGLISPVLLPQLELASLSTRNLITFSDVAQPIWGFKLFIQNLLFPFFLTHTQLSTERVIFPGLIIIFLSVFGYLKYKHKHKYFVFFWVIFSLLFILGQRIPFFIFLYKHFPLMQWMRVTTRMWIISNLFIIIFAGLGINWIFRSSLSKTKHKKIILFSLITFTLLELIIINYKIFSRPIQPNLTPQSFYAYLAKNMRHHERVYCVTGCLSLQKLGELNINSTAGNNPIQLANFVSYLQTAAGYSYKNYIPILPPYQVFDLKPQPNAEKLGNLNTKYIVSPYRLLDSRLKKITESQGYILYQNNHAKYAWLQDDGHVIKTNKTPNKIEISLETPINNQLVISELFYPGWKASDQNDNTLHISNTKPFRSINVDRSVRKVVLTYWPRSFTIGLGLFGFSWLIIIYAHYNPKFFQRFGRAGG